MSKKFRTMLTIVLALVMTACVASFAACGYVASCNHNYVDGVCTYCNERDPECKYEVTITNKDDLTALWVEGSDSRKVSVLVTLGGMRVGGNVLPEGEAKSVEFMVETSAANVVAVGDDNETLSAKGEGTATITVSVLDGYTGDVASDSVEIAVIPYLRGVQILNKEALSEVWMIEEASRQLQLGFNPEYYNKNNPEYTVASDNEEVLTVGADKKTLNVVKEGTATVTVSAQDAVGNEHTDSIKLTVRPVLSSLAIENKEVLSANWNDWTVDRTIGVKMEPADYYTTDNTPVVVTFGTEGVLALDGLTLSAKKVGTTTVTVSYAGKEDSFTVTVERVAPFVKFAKTNNFDEDKLFFGVYENEATSIPAMTATTCDGTALTAKVELVQDGTDAKLENGVLTAPQGNYQLVYTVTDSEDKSLVTTTTVDVTVARRLIGWNSDDNAWKVVGNEFVKESEQKLTAEAGTDQFMAFSYEPSKYYYVEVELVGTKYNAGVTNYVYINGKLDKKKTFIGLVHDKDGVEVVALDYDLTRKSGSTGYQKVFGSRNELYYTYMHTQHAEKYRKLEQNVKDGIKTSKIAIARMGDYFFMFWNDQYVYMYTSEYYADNGTVPGLVVEGEKGKTTAQNIVYMSGQETVKEKVLALTHDYKDLNTAYVPNETYKLSYNDKLFTSNGVTEENGLSFTFTDPQKGFNNGCVTNFVWFAEDFTYSWEYVNNGGDSNTNDNSGMIAEIRTSKYYKPLGGEGKLQLGAYYRQGKFLGLKVGSKKITEGVDGSKGFKFTYTRKLYSNYTEITMLAKSLADGKVYIGTYKYSKTDKNGNGCWDDALTIQLHNTYAKGTYTNITWTNEAVVEEHTEHVYGDVTYTWSDDLMTCTATRSCQYYGCTHKEAEKVDVTTSVKAATCTDKEVTTYTATFTNAAFKAQTKTQETADELGHHMVDVPAQDSTEEAVGWSAYQRCDNPGCNHTEGYVEIPKKGSAPTLTLTADNLVDNEDGTYTWSIMADAETNIPAASALTWKGVDVSESVTEALQGTTATLTGGVLTAPQGPYTLTYTVADPINTDRVTTVTVTVNAYRNLIAYNDGTWAYVEGKQYVADEEQQLYNTKTSTSNDDAQQTILNYTASKNYYFEAEYVASKGYWGGVAHYTYDSANGLNKTRMLVSVVLTRDGVSHYFADYKNGTNAGLRGSRNEASPMNIASILYQSTTDQGKDDRGFTENPLNSGDTKISKMAIARVDDYFICFWNDQYVAMYAANDHYTEAETVPGLYLLNRNNGSPNQRSGETVVRNINYISGKVEVMAKINELTENGKGINVGYKAHGSINDGTLFESHEATDGKLSYTFKSTERDFNYGMVSNYVWFDNDFTYSWDYVPTNGQVGTAHNRAGATAEMRARPNYYAYGGDNQLWGWLGRKSSDEGAITFENLGYNRLKNTADELANVDASKGFRYTVSRKLPKDEEGNYIGYAEWTYTATSLADGTTYTKTLKYNSTGDDSQGIVKWLPDNNSKWNDTWKDVVTLQWHNTYTAGEYTNITWKNSVDA